MPGAGEAQHLASVFGRGHAHALTRVARGALGAVYRLESVLEGEPVVTAVKELYWQIPTESQAGREVRFTQACRAAGASTSTAIATIGGQWLATDEAGRAWRAYAWHDGSTPGWDDVPAAVWMAKQAAIVHRLDWQPDDGEPAVAAHWYERIDVDWQEALAPVRAEHWAAPLVERIEELTAATEFVNAVSSGPTVGATATSTRPMSSSTARPVTSSTGTTRGRWTRSATSPPCSSTCCTASRTFRPSTRHTATPAVPPG